MALCWLPFPLPATHELSVVAVVVEVGERSLPLAQPRALSLNLNRVPRILLAAAQL